MRHLQRPSAANEEARSSASVTAPNVDWPVSNLAFEVCWKLRQSTASVTGLVGAMEFSCDRNRLQCIPTFNVARHPKDVMPGEESTGCIDAFKMSVVT